MNKDLRIKWVAAGTRKPEPGNLIPYTVYRLQTFLIAVLIFILISCSPEQHPNLVYLLADQHRADVLSFVGDQQAMTPNLDRLAQAGMVFENAVAVSPVCAPYRSSLFTGKYISSTGMVINEVCMNPNHQAIAYVLHDGGYDMAYLGKWHLVDIHKREIPQGPARLGFQYASVFKAYNFNHLNYKGYYWTDNGDQVVRKEIPGNQTEFWTEEAIDYIQKASKGDQPFALFLSYSPPHDPWREDNVDPEAYEFYRDSLFYLPDNYLPDADQYADRMKSPEKWAYWTEEIPQAKKAYYAMVYHLDAQVGRILDCIHDEGIEEETIVIYTSDHGEMFGAQGRVYKLTFYEEAARVPFIVQWAGHTPPASVSDVCLNTPDIAPSILGLMNLTIPAEMEGMDLSGHFLGHRDPEPEFAFLQGMGHTYLWMDGSEWRAIRDKRYTYARYLVDESEHLFDHVNDPLEMHDLIHDPDYASQLSAMRKAMTDKMDEINDEFQPCTWYRDHWMDPDDNYSIIGAAQGAFTGEFEAIPSQRVKQ